jgi:hypothetical protein
MDPDAEIPDRFAIGLSFSGTICSGCSKPREPGRCPECGVDVPASNAVHGLVRARQRALNGLLDEARELRSAFASLPPADIRVSAGQFATVVSDAGVFGRVAEMPALGHSLSQVDFDDRKAIGSSARQTIVRHLEQLRGLLDASRAVARFEPVGPALELRDVAIESGAWGADFVLRLLQTVTADTIAEARGHETELQRLLDDTPFSRMPDDLFDRVVESIVPDIDERVSRAFDRPGRYSDDLGLLDIARVFGAFADSDTPLALIGERARRFLAHLLYVRSGHTPESDAVLVLPAATLAVLDRPLHAHRVAEMVRALADEAWNANPMAVGELVERTTQQGPLVFAAAARIARGLQLLSMQEASGFLDDDDIATTLMRTYLDSSEAAFRTLAWLTLDLDRIAGGGSTLAADRPPTLGSIEQQLHASDHPVGPALAACTDSALRNAAAHAQFRYDRTTETVIDLRDGHTWSLDEFESRMHALVAGISGIEAGYCAFLIDREIDLGTPTWLRNGEAPAAVQFFAQASLGAYGYEVLQVNADASAIWVAGDVDDPARLLPALAGLCATTITGEHVRVMSADGSPVITVSTAAMNEALAAPEPLRDLAVVSPFLSAARHAGRDQGQALRRVLAVQVILIAVTDVPLLAAHAAPDALARLAGRLAYVLAFGKGNAAGADPPRRILERLARARAASVMASRGDHQALRRMGRELAALIDWASAQNVRWPPL